MNLDEKFIVIKPEENNLYFVYRKDDSLFEEEDYNLSVSFFEEYIKEEINNNKITGITNPLDISIKSSVVCSKFLFVRLSKKNLELKLEN